MLQMPGSLKSLFSHARLPAGRTRRGRVRRPSLELLERRVVLTDVGGQWRGTLTDTNSGFPEEIDNITINLTQSNGSLQGSIHIESQAHPQYFIDFTVNGTASNKVVLNQQTVTAHNDPPNIFGLTVPWHRFGTFTLDVSADAGSMTGIWSSFVIFGGVNVQRPAAPPPPPPPPPPPDIAMSTASVAGSTLSYAYQTAGNPGPVQFALYQSADQAFDSSDKVLAGQTVPVGPSGTGTFNLSAFAPDPARPYLLVVADPGGQIKEANENNNTVHALWQPADIEMLSASFDDLYASRGGDAIHFSYRTIGDTGPFNVALYLSANRTFDTSDTFVASTRVTPDPKASAFGGIRPNVSLSIPQSKPYLLVVADPARVVPEFTESNNTIWIPRLVTLPQLRRIMPGLPVNDAARYIDPLNRTMVEFQISTPKREAAFLAQLAHESSDLTDWTEDPTVTKPVRTRVTLNGVVWTVTSSSVTSYTLTRRLANGQTENRTVQVTGPNFERYDNQQGNGEGEGRLFFGRGPIQITFKDTYKAFGDYLHTVGSYRDTDFTQDSNWELLSDRANHPDVGIRAAGWFWTRYKQSISVSRWKTPMNQLADSVKPEDDSKIPELPARRKGQTPTEYNREVNRLYAPYVGVQGINLKLTLVINGGTTGLADRLRRYQLALRVLGLRS